MKQTTLIRSVFGLVFKISRSYFVLLLLNSALFSAQILCNVIFPKYLINELMAECRTDALILFVGLIVGSNLISTFGKRTVKRFLDVKERDVMMEIERVFAKKIMSVPYRYLEDPHYLDLKERATFAMENQSAVANLIGNLTSMLNQLFTIIGLIAVMLQLSWILVVSLLLTIGIILLIQQRFSSFQQNFFADLIPVNRRYGYYVGLAFDTNYSMDIRYYGMSDMIGDTVKRFNLEINKWFGRFYRRMGVSMGLFQIVVVLQTALAYGYVGAQTIQNSLGIGDLTMYATAAISFSSAVMALGGAVVTIFQMLGYLEPFAELMSVPDEETTGGTATLSAIESIEFDNVTFSYPASDKKVLDGICFKVSQGEKISIVGLNGAGKSTVVKLLCRLYTPNSGRILVNGIDITEYEHISYLAQISAVFQDFTLFDISIAENITCHAEGDEARIAELLDEVGLTEKIASLPHGIKTRFGKEYDAEGTEFSGGQAQKIAIARALFKRSSLVILDEPTSALDPIAESEIYENFNRLVGDNTALYISHRMSSSVFCDRILVLEEGRIKAFGTHKELMQDTDGTYYKLFNAQAVNYKLED